LVNMALSLQGFDRWTFSSRLVALGLGGLTLTTLFGLTLAANRVWPFLGGRPFFPVLHAHVQLAILGWVTPMTVGVAARTYPMFLLASEPPIWAERMQLWGPACGVPAVMIGLLGAPSLLAAGALALLAGVGSHAAWVVEIARVHRRPRLDW